MDDLPISPGTERSACIIQAPPQGVPETACPLSVPGRMFMDKQQCEQV